MHLFTHEATFLRYIITGHGIKADESKLEAIRSCPILQNIHDVQSFHGLSSPHGRFIRNVSTTIAPMTEVIKGTSFKWTLEA